ncbi:hypothetical protein VTK26DRAFT_1930 [Humicola hyalothermophila]
MQLAFDRVLQLQVTVPGNRGEEAQQIVLYRLRVLRHDHTKALERRCLLLGGVNLVHGGQKLARELGQVRRQHVVVVQAQPAQRDGRILGHARGHARVGQDLDEALEQLGDKRRHLLLVLHGDLARAPAGIVDDAEAAVNLLVEDRIQVQALEQDGQNRRQERSELFKDKLCAVAEEGVCRLLHLFGRVLHAETHKLKEGRLALDELDRFLVVEGLNDGAQQIEAGHQEVLVGLVKVGVVVSSNRLLQILVDKVDAAPKDGLGIRGEGVAKRDGDEGEAFQKREHLSRLVRYLLPPVDQRRHQLVAELGPRQHRSDMLGESLDAVVEDPPVLVLVLAEAQDVLLDDGSTERLEVLAGLFLQVRHGRRAGLLYLLVLVQHLPQQTVHERYKVGLPLGGVLQVGRPGRVPTKRPACYCPDYRLVILEQADQIRYQFRQVGNDHVHAAFRDCAEGQDGGLSVRPILVLQVCLQVRENGREHRTAEIGGKDVEGGSGALPERPLLVRVLVTILVQLVDFALLQVVVHAGQLLICVAIQGCLCRLLAPFAGDPALQVLLCKLGLDILLSILFVLVVRCAAQSGDVLGAVHHAFQKHGNDLLNVGFKTLPQAVMLADRKPEFRSLAGQILVVALLLGDDVLNKAVQVGKELVWPSIDKMDKSAADLAADVGRRVLGEEEEVLKKIVDAIEHGLRLAGRKHVDGCQRMGADLEQRALGRLDELGQQDVEWSLAVVLPFQ